MDKLKKEFASKLLKVKAIKLQPNDPFTWASGWKSPFYCDNRKTLSFPELRNYVKLELVHAILEQFPEADAVAGVATGAIAQGALVADELNMPFVYVRSKPKDHGMQNLIEGQLDPKAKVVVVEDLISTGGSSLKAVEALRKNGNVANYRDTEDLASGIHWVLEEADRAALKQACLQKVAQNYSQHAVALKYIEVYNEAMAYKNYKL